MYFIGVTTGQSSIMRIFPIWAKALGLDACIKGIDITLHAGEASVTAWGCDLTYDYVKINGDYRT